METLKGKLVLTPVDKNTLQINDYVIYKTDSNKILLGFIITIYAEKAVISFINTKGNGVFEYKQLYNICMEFVSSGETHHLILSPDQWRKILNEKFIEFEKEFDFKINSNENVAEIIFPVYVSQDDQEWIKKIGGMTVGQLLDFIEKNNIPRDGKILYHRIEDDYFNGQDISGMRGDPDSSDGIFPPGSKTKGWRTAKVKGEFYHQQIEFDKKLAPGGEFWDKEQYPDLKPELMKITSEEELENFLEEYIVAWCTINYDGENLYITAHY